MIEGGMPAASDAAQTALLAALERSELALVPRPERAGFDYGVQSEIDGLPNRARIKLFQPTTGTTAAFFYKDSQIKGSTDRFSYGAMIWKGGALPSDSELQAILKWLAQGLRPDERPAGIRRAFPFTIPD